ncbi:MAG: RibD family protein, partial [Lysobacteraceae bacterium]
VKLATSLDGRTALANGDSKWISGEASRRDVMHWRARAGALLTGAGTVLADDPQLTVRFDHSASDDSASGETTAFVAPLRVVLDPGLATVGRGRIRDGAAPTLYLHSATAKPPRGFDAAHAVVPMRDGLLDLTAVLQLLAARGINEVQVEAGATLAGALLRAELVDEVLLYVAPVLLGADARPLFDGLHIDEMSQRLRLRTVETRRLGDDLRLLLRPERLA